MFQKYSDLEKFFGSQGWEGLEYHKFTSKIFFRAVPKNVGGKSFSVSYFSGIEMLYE